MTPPTLQSEWARLLLGSLHRAGVRDVVLSPGSRSTPFTWAALREPGLRCRTVIDERSAAFYALGRARVTGRPVLLICTSGSASANYLPALVEAAESFLPVIVLTADRPLELQGFAAPQTIDQVKLYGDHARAFIDLGAPDSEPAMLRALPRLAARAVATARGPVPGPVHLNARARKPLEPRSGHGPAEEELHATVDRLLGSVPEATDPATAADDPAIRRVAEAASRARRGLIVCGPAVAWRAASSDAVAELARATGFPVAVEAASQLRFDPPASATILDALDTLLDVPGFADGHAPELIIQVGRPPTASAWHRALTGWGDTRRHVLAAHGWPDPWGTADSVIRGPLDAAVRALAGAFDGADASDPARSAEWSDRLREANAIAWTITEEALSGPFSEGAAVRAVVDGLRPGSLLAVGNSLPIREVDAFVPAGPRGLTVWFQRGANGIDGLVSGAAGAASASGRPAALLVGDVSLAHDLTGLALVRDLEAPLTVVVLNNGGGRIFDRLPMADTLDGAPERAAWRTPPAVDFRAAADTFGLPYARAEDRRALAEALSGLESGGLIEVVVPDGGTTAHQRELGRRLADALRG